MTSINDKELSYQDIYDALEEGYYNANAQKPKFERYAENHIFDENMSVKWNREEAVRRNQAYKDALNAYYAIQNEKDKEFQEDLVSAIMNYTGFSYEKAEMIYSKAYDRGHSNGYYEVLNYAEEIADFVYDFIRKE